VLSRIPADQGKKQQDRAHQCRAEEPAAIGCIEAAIALQNDFLEKEVVSLCKKRDFF
jgi:hypothetical protein